MVKVSLIVLVLIVSTYAQPESYIGEIRLVPFNFAPDKWAYCSGQLLPIAQNPALFSILGTTYGGNGQTTFALPDLRGRVPIDWGTGPGLTTRDLGESSGSDTVILDITKIPGHTHTPTLTTCELSDVLTAPQTCAVGSKTDCLVVDSNGCKDDIGSNPTLTGAASSGGLAHPNEMPYLTLAYVISIDPNTAQFPNRNKKRSLNEELDLDENENQQTPAEETHEHKKRTPPNGLIHMFAGNFEVRGWRSLSGQVLSTTDPANAEIYSSIGTTFGAGTNTFSLPNMRGRVAIGVSTTNPLGQIGGTEVETLGSTHVRHSHTTSVMASSDTAPSMCSKNQVFRKAQVCTDKLSTSNPTGYVLNNVGGSQSHENMQPFLAINYQILTNSDNAAIDVDSHWIGEIRLIAYDTVPSGWMACEGQTLDIGPNQGLFALLGTTFGGNGMENFKLPDLRDKIAIHTGTRPGGGNYVLGQLGGSNTVTLNNNQIPTHTHTTGGSLTNKSGVRRGAANTCAATGPVFQTVNTCSAGTSFGGSSSGGGSNAAHNNMQPFIALKYIIATSGTWPDRS